MDNRTNKEKTQRHFKILALDGGGVKGIFSIQLLSLIEKELGIRVYDTFDIIVGTSTGSIAAGAISIKYPLEKLVGNYTTWAKEVFKKKRIGSWIHWCSKYDSKPLEDHLHQTFENIKLGDIEKPLIINATDASHGGVYVFKSSYQKKQRGEENYSRDGNTPLFKAVLASCAAPTYFDPIDINGVLVCDGGLWANNPALVGYVDAKVNFQATSIKIFSLGTGIKKQSYKWPRFGAWGFCTGWRRTEFVDFVMSCQTMFPQNSLQLIDSEGILRINPEIKKCRLDNYKAIPTLTATAKTEFADKRTQIKNFLTDEVDYAT
ncbi:MAG: patatin-like phospholipase family protein [Chromatiales bacterium]|nr:patatin-like phospholipase family protein [Chromatiales bacterium]